MKTLVMFFWALAIALTGCIFWSDRPFYWAGSVIDSKTQFAVGVTLVYAGVATAFIVGRQSVKR